MLPEEGISTAIANMSNASLSTIAGLSTASNVYDPNTFQRISTPIIGIFSTYSNLNGRYSNLNIIEDHYEHFSFNISTLETLTVNELNWLQLSTTMKYIDLLNPDHPGLPMPINLYESARSSILDSFSTGLEQFEYSTILSKVISDPIISTFITVQER
jgi:hypothetical protein